MAADTPPSVPVLLGLGANIGKPEVQLSRAVDLLGGCMEIAEISQLYRTAPVGIVDQPDFLNIVIRGETAENVFDFHRSIAGIEDELGRVRHQRNGPRAIDIDLLAYGDLVLESRELIVPHPRLHERRFVLIPLVEVAASWRHPRLDRRGVELLEALPAGAGVEPLGEFGGSGRIVSRRTTGS